ncbi:putative triacylglycerol lipase [Lyophyllum shimeji]|uniref:Triacylglycerol lipase n=1 Tax=Lyophyllum shimeji TaxID=47721 RepID=A0A9P3PKV3_LYOSH|nr:putative triacylglycerol lipase [Lyophyllum shimeji]
MNSVYFPAHVVLVLRRIVNVISSLSISNQYLLLRQAQADEERIRHRTSPPSSRKRVSLRESSSWPSCLTWDWPRLVWSDTGAVNDSGSLHSPGSRWSWPALLSIFAQQDTQTQTDDPPPPPKPHKSDRRSAPRTKLPSPEPTQAPASPDTIHQLMHNPTLYDPLRAPRYPIVLCHGLYGFDSRGPLKFPSMRMHYWSNVLNILRHTVGAEVIVTSVPGTGSIASRAEILDRQLQCQAHGRAINFLAHSMGGLDCRHLITHIKPEVYAPLSLTTISTPHRGSPFMDWCADNIGIGKLRQKERELAKARAEMQPVSPPRVGAMRPKPDTASSLSLASLPSSFTTLLLSIVDSPAYANLTSHYLNEIFNPSTPDDPTVKYFSVAGRIAGVSIWHPFWLPKMVLDGVEEKHRSKMRAIWEQEMAAEPSSETPLWAQEREWGNDGLVTVQSARWGKFLGIMEGCDHWEMRGARGIEFGVDLPAIPAIGLGVSRAGHRAAAGDGWGLPDWGRFVSAWKKEEKIHAASSRPDVKAPTRREEREQERARDDAIIKSTTDKLSAVFDWLTDQVPSTALIGGKTKVVAAEVKVQVAETMPDLRVPEKPRSPMQKHMDQEVKGRIKNELATKKDLERFYVALSRKLYDEGL